MLQRDSLTLHVPWIDEEESIKRKEQRMEATERGKKNKSMGRKKDGIDVGSKERESEG